MNRHLCRSSRAESHPESFKSILLSLSLDLIYSNPFPSFPFFGSFSTARLHNLRPSPPLSRHLTPLSHGTCSGGCSSIPSMAPIILGQHSPSWSGGRGGYSPPRVAAKITAAQPSRWQLPLHLHGMAATVAPPDAAPSPLLLGGGAYSPSLEWRQRQPVQGLALALIPSPRCIA